MEENTHINEHWGSDIHLTQEEESNPVADFIKHSIEGDIYLNEKLNLGNSTKDIKPDIEDYDNINLFSTPQYKQPLALVGHNTYTSKTQKWFGNIVDIKENTFLARLIDAKNPTTHEYAEFDILDIQPDDADFLKIGASFYWSIGYITKNSQRKRESILKFKRTVEFTVEDVDRISDKAKSIFKSIKWEDNNDK